MKVQVKTQTHKSHVLPNKSNLSTKMALAQIKCVSLFHPTKKNPNQRLKTVIQASNNNPFSIGCSTKIKRKKD